jgi:dTDP-4-dehydrorhamnose reductase
MATGDRPDTRVVLVTGATGYLGRRVLRALAGAGADAVAVGSMALDVTNESAVRSMVTTVRPAAVISLAGVNPGQGAPEHMNAVNGRGAGVGAAAAAEVGARLVHVSTDVVLRGDPGEAPYPDRSPPAPRNAYGASKAAGEAAVAAAHPGAVVVRTSLIYDLDTPDRATTDYARRLADDGAVTLFADVWRQPVHAVDLAEALVALALRHREAGGTLNVAGRQAVTRETLGRRLLDHWEVPGRHRVVAAPVSDPTVPVDLRLCFDGADQLGLRLRGLDQVLTDATRLGVTRLRT